MKTLKLLVYCGLAIGIASCGNPNQNRDSDGADSIFSDSVATDTATWGGDSTPTTTDSLGSPSLP